MYLLIFYFHSKRFYFIEIIVDKNAQFKLNSTNLFLNSNNKKF